MPLYDKNSALHKTTQNLRSTVHDPPKACLLNATLAIFSLPGILKLEGLSVSKVIDSNTRVCYSVTFATFCLIRSFILIFV